MAAHLERARVGITLVAMSLVLLACSPTVAHPKKSAVPWSLSSGRADLSPSTASTVQLAGGVSVTVPAGAVAGRGTLTGLVRPLPGPAPRGLTASAFAYDFEVMGSHLVGEATLRFRRVHPVTGTTGPPPVLAYFDRATRAWTAAASIYDARTATLTARTPHLSLWSVFSVDTGALLRGMKSFLGGVIGTNSHADQPSSPGQDQLAVNGVHVVSSSGSLVKWSAGVVGARTRVKVVDNRGYALAMTYPQTWTYTRIGSADDIEKLAIDRVSALLTSSPRGLRTVIVPSGRGVEFTVPPGTGGTVVAEPSVEAYLLSGLLYGIDTLRLVYGGLPWVKEDPSKTLRAVRAMFDATDCVRSMSKMMTNPVATAHDAGEVFRTAAELATGCLGEQWKIAYPDGGAVGSFALGVVLWLVDGVKLVFAGIGAALDTALYFNGYRIAVSSKPPSGQWTGSSLTITDHSLGSVTRGMSISRAIAASGVRMSSSGDGIYTADDSITGATRLIYSWGGDCLDATLHNTGPGTKVSTLAGVSLGDQMSQVRALYGGQARDFTADPHWVGPGNLHAGIIVSFSEGVLLFIGSSKDLRGGTVTSIRGATDPRIASSIFC